MARRRRGRITVQHQPTGAARGMMRGMGVVHAIFGGVFTLIALTQKGTLSSTAAKTVFAELDKIAATGETNETYRYLDVRE